MLFFAPMQLLNGAPHSRKFLLQIIRCYERTQHRFNSWTGLQRPKDVLSILVKFILQHRIQSWKRRGEERAIRQIRFNDKRRMMLAHSFWRRRDVRTITIDDAMDGFTIWQEEKELAKFRVSLIITLSLREQFLWRNILHAQQRVEVDDLHVEAFIFQPDSN